MAYTIEEEQELNQLKEWWKDNGKAIIAAFILGVGGMLGWRYWQSYQANQIMQASAEYDALVYTANKDAAAQQAKVAEFVKAHDKTSYAVFSLLDEAKGFVALLRQVSVLPQLDYFALRFRQAQGLESHQTYLRV